MSVITTEVGPAFQVGRQTSERRKRSAEDTAGIQGKALPLQVWTGREGSRRLRLPYFKTIGT
jgi:hypothetical protein